MGERYEFPVASWAGVFGSTISEEEFRSMMAERALWFWEWECPRGFWYGVDGQDRFYWMTCGASMVEEPWPTLGGSIG